MTPDILHLTILQEVHNLSQMYSSSYKKVNEAPQPEPDDDDEENLPDIVHYKSIPKEHPKGKEVEDVKPVVKKEPGYRNAFAVTGPGKKGFDLDKPKQQEVKSRSAHQVVAFRTTEFSIWCRIPTFIHFRRSW